MVASDSLLSSASDLSTLADTVEKLREENPKQTSITGLNRPYSLLEALYPVCAPTWSKDDGSLSEEKLLQFLKEGKRLYTAERKGFERMIPFTSPVLTSAVCSALAYYRKRSLSHWVRFWATATFPA